MLARNPALVLPWLVAAAAFVACSGGAGGAPQAEPADEAIPVVHLRIEWARDNARDLPTLLRSAGTVFVGEVTAIRGQRMETLAAPGRSAIPISSFDVG